jgi:segregation and condensation protein A
MEPRFAGLLPEVLLGLGPAEFARIAAVVLAPRPAPEVSTEHIHVPRASVAEQAAILAARLRRLHRATFRQLVADCAGTYEVVARFLAVLELYREGNVVLEQAEPLGDLYVTWSPGTPAGGAGDGEEEDGWREHA